MLLMLDSHDSICQTKERGRYFYHLTQHDTRQHKRSLPTVSKHECPSGRVADNFKEISQISL